MISSLVQKASKEVRCKLLFGKWILLLVLESVSVNDKDRFLSSSFRELCGDHNEKNRSLQHANAKIKS